MGQGSSRTGLKITNNTKTDITNIEVYDIDSYDWASDNRPDHNFQGVSIFANSSLIQVEDVNTAARNCPIGMKLFFRDGSMDQFRINQKYAIGEVGPNFLNPEKAHDITYCKQSDNTIEIIIENTNAQKENMKAADLENEAKMLMVQKRYREALDKLEEASKFANKTATKTSIKSATAKTWNLYGKSQLEEAWAAEIDETHDRHQESETKFNEARTKFENAEKIDSNWEYRKNITLVTNKIDGNHLFNRAIALEEEAYNLFQKDQNSVLTKNKYNEALAKYKEAKMKFEEGNGREFLSSLKLTNKAIGDIERIVGIIDRVDLKRNLGQVKSRGGGTSDQTSFQENVNTEMLL